MINTLTNNVPPIPVMPCFLCNVLTDETQSVHGVGHYCCFMKGNEHGRTTISHSWKTNNKSTKID